MEGCELRKWEVRTSIVRPLDGSGSGPASVRGHRGWNRSGICNAQDYPLDLTELRGCDARLANARRDYLNYNRLRKMEAHEHTAKGDPDLRYMGSRAKPHSQYP
jgi:hypothetical protein